MRIIITLLSLIFIIPVNAQETILSIPGLKQEVEIKVDPYGIAHIYAQNEEDLFFSQGYYAASDRLFQFEIWRRQATGTVAEILGERELKRDIGTRLFQFRGDMDEEMNHYHSRGKLIIESFVKGVNAYIDQTRENPGLLPMEFELLDIKPQHWTPAVVISRHQGLLGNIDDELDIGRLVALIGAEKVREVSWFHPQDPILEIDPAIDSKLLFKDILELYNAYRRPIKFRPEDLIADVANDLEKFRDLAHEWDKSYELLLGEELESIGSNNWVVSGDHTQSGYPMMANDPHRTLATPSLRYMSHLVAPGWNVIGGGEPEIPGISIGHNEYGAWGLTVYRTDAEDLYVYQLNPDNHNQYWFRDNWVDMNIIRDTIMIKDADPYIVDHKYTVHGPVAFIDENAHVGYAVRCGWLEVGGSPYLASLRMNQAKNWEDFRIACNYSNIPGENMIWADREGNIGWQAVGIAPRRENFSGLVPVPGDGRYEWDDYLPIVEKPSLFNPDNGIIITANANVTNPDYDHWEAVGYSWSDPYREDRLSELLHSGRKHSMTDMTSYQTDYLSIPARQIQRLIKYADCLTDLGKKCKQALLKWDCRMEVESIEATIYFELEKKLKRAYEVDHVPEEAQPYYYPQVKKVMDWLLYPSDSFGNQPMEGRDDFLGGMLDQVAGELTKKFGSMDKWQYGQLDYKHVLIRHPLSMAVKEDVRQKLDVGPAPRGGYGLTPGSTSNSLNQLSGASFRIIVDTENWDHSLAMNSPGQNGNPDHPNYRNLFDMWVKDQFFPLYFSVEKVEQNSMNKIKLKPSK